MSSSQPLEQDGNGGPDPEAAPSLMTPSGEFDKIWDKGWKKELRKELGATAPSPGRGRRKRDGSERRGLLAQGGGDRPVGDIYGEAEEGNFTEQVEATRAAAHRVELTPNDGAASWERRGGQIDDSQASRYDAIKVIASVLLCQQFLRPP